ncbi:MAG: ATP-binding protein, partial [Alphaproteobacteria bacterium]|nr:ATP-binding protein [Alphaproteobacteria bacterium]
LGNAARKILAPAWESGNTDKIKAAMEDFLTEFRKPAFPPSKYLRSGVTVQDVFEWLYEVDHVRLSYGLIYNGVDLEKLSPGTKGIVLLILYLGMDIADTRPLIVDQPDENLDNESIYELLTAYFNTAKTRRQIILITHNPNLVVNADSEQVIVATAARRDNGLPHITYQSGSLENNLPDGQGIRQQVCRILEGGSDAFLKRERRYALEQR